MSIKDYYSILEIDRTASSEDIKKSYRKLSMKYHPDKNNGDIEAENRFKEINEAYSVLSNEEKKAEYDNPNQFANIFNGFDPFSFMRRHSHRPNPNAPRDGRPISIEAELPLETFLFGGKYMVKLNFTDTCTACGGKGYTKANKCDLCHGDGFVHITEQRGNFISTNSMPCMKCSGVGAIPDDKCPECNNGGVNVSKEFIFDINPEVGMGEAITIFNSGRSGINGGKNGDVTIIITGVNKKGIANLEPHEHNALKEIARKLNDGIKST